VVKKRTSKSGPLGVLKERISSSGRAAKRGEGKNLKKRQRRWNQH